MLALEEAPERAVAVTVDGALLARVRAEFCEMPGLCLTSSQARRLWALDGAVCKTVLAALIQDGFLRRTRDGSFGRADMA
jgi:hypothetical protein